MFVKTDKINEYYHKGIYTSPYGTNPTPQNGVLIESKKSIKQVLRSLEAKGKDAKK